MAKEPEKPGGEPEPKVEPKPEPIDPATGERESETWRRSVLDRLDDLSQKVEAQGKMIQEWGMEPADDPEPKPDDTSDPDRKREPLDEWAD